jgi:predicted transcriptional regulator
MARQPQDVTDAELAVLQALWDRAPATTRELADRLYPGGKASHFATVQKLLERLEEKDFVQRERSDGPQTFRPALSRDDLLGRWLETVAEKLCRGSLTPLLTHLVRARRLPAKDYQALRALIDELEQANKTKKPKS